MDKKELLEIEECEDRLYKKLVDDICNEKCVLLLGPEVCVSERDNEKGIIETVGYKEYFKSCTESLHNIKYFESENLFAYDIGDEDAERSIMNVVSSFYARAGDDQILNLVSKIKFPLIINVLPDKSIERVSIENGFNPSYTYFSNSIPADCDEKPTKENTIIFNIFGDYTDLQSLILTHKHLYEIIENILSKNPFPKDIFNFIQKATSFIFLGFKFDSWYYQLLCHKLKIKNWDTKTLKESLGTPFCDRLNPITVIMKNNFNLSFAKENPFQVINNVKIRLEEQCTEMIRKIGSSSKKSVFVSYSWKNDGEGEINRATIVDLILDKLSGREDIRIIIDKKDMPSGQSIDSFMTLIGKGRSVLRVISDKYLQSEFCMKEAMYMDKYSNTDNRIFTIVYSQKDINGKEDLDLNKSSKYKDYWADRYKQVTQKDIGSPENYMVNSSKYYIYVQIYHFIEKFMSKIQGEKNFILSDNDFQLKNDLIFLNSDDSKNRFEKFVEDILEKIKE